MLGGLHQSQSRVTLQVSNITRDFDPTYARNYTVEELFFVTTTVTIIISVVTTIVRIRYSYAEQTYSRLEQPIHSY